MLTDENQRNQELDGITICNNRLGDVRKFKEETVVVPAATKKHCEEIWKYEHAKTGEAQHVIGNNK